MPATAIVDPMPTPIVRPRSDEMIGRTLRVRCPEGTAFVTINQDDHGDPFEVFVEISTAGSAINALGHSLGRMASLYLRTPSPISVDERVHELIDQLRGTTGGTSVGFGEKRIGSLGDGVAYALSQWNPVGIAKSRDFPPIIFEEGERADDDDLCDPDDGFELDPRKVIMAGGLSREEREVHGITELWPDKETVMRIQALRRQPKVRLDLCPECGNASLAHSEGCKKCQNPDCAYSAC